MIIYPADLLFVALWNVLKWFIDPVTRDKVQPIYYYYGVQQFIEDEYIPQSMVKIKRRIFFKIFCNSFTERVENLRMSSISVSTATAMCCQRRRSQSRRRSKRAAKHSSQSSQQSKDRLSQVNLVNPPNNSDDCSG